MSAAFDLYPTSAPAPVRPPPPPQNLISQPAVIASVLVVDVAAIALSGALVEIPAGGPWSDLQTPTAIVLAATLAVLAILKARWSYTIAALSSPSRQALDLTVAFALVFGGLLASSVFLADDPAPVRQWVVAWVASAGALLAVSRAVLARKAAIWSREGRLARRTVIVGGGEAAERLITGLERSGRDSIRILGLFDDRDDARSPEMVGAYCKLGRFADLEGFCREQRIDLLIIALPPTAEERILQIMKKLWVLPVDVRVAAHESKLKLRSRAYNYIGDVPFLPVFDKPMSDWSVALKAIEDRVLAAIGLAALSPLLALIALAVKFDSKGPVFFKQKRHGFNNEEIDVYKFRSMYTDRCDQSGVAAVTRGDPRVTRVGAFLRRSSLDELPQLINVLRGELSLVGPRPHVMQAKASGVNYHEIVDSYFARHKVKPGITGWAQVNGWRGETDTMEKVEQRVAHDLFYIDNWSMLFDLRILAMTPLSLVTTKNAY